MLGCAPPQIQEAQAELLEQRALNERLQTQQAAPPVAASAAPVSTPVDPADAAGASALLSPINGAGLLVGGSIAAYMAQQKKETQEALEGKLTSEKDAVASLQQAAQEVRRSPGSGRGCCLARAGHCCQAWRRRLVTAR